MHFVWLMTTVVLLISLFDNRNVKGNNLEIQVTQIRQEMTELKERMDSLQKNIEWYISSFLNNKHLTKLNSMEQELAQEKIYRINLQKTIESMEKAYGHQLEDLAITIGNMNKQFENRLLAKANATEVSLGSKLEETVRTIEQRCRGSMSNLNQTLENLCEQITQWRVPKQVNGGWTEWGSWTNCSSTCGKGMNNRVRTCTNPAPANGGNFCDGVGMEYNECQISSCKVNGGWTEWGSWTNCSSTCGKGMNNRVRTCTNPAPANGGNYCDGIGMEYNECQISSCKEMCKTIDVARNITGFIVNETNTKPGEFVLHNQSIQTVCGEGYRQHGILTCNAGKWMGNSTCEPDVTGCVLKDPGMHFISLGNRTVLKVGEKANVSCKFGYEIVPNISAKGSYEYNYPDSESTADPSEMPETEDNENLIAVSDGNYTCIDNGKWEPELRFSCKQIMCDSFEKYNLENGNIIDSTHGVDTVGTVVSFQCNPGYTRHGPETRTCQTDGTWSGKCVTCQMDGRNASITCPAPCVPEGARKTGSHTYEKGSTVKFHCPRSKTQDRDYRRNIRHCIIKDEYVSWNGTQINCKEIICDKGDHYGFENGIVTYSSSSAYVSTVASFRCNPGYKRRGPKTRICQKDGTWSGECVTCQKHQPSSSTCPAPCVPDGAIKIGSRSYEIGSIIQLYCFQSNMNYNVQNSYIRHCVNDGKSASWNGTNINCKVKCEPLTDTYNVVQTGVVPGILSDKTIVELNCNGSLAPVKAECRKGHWHPKKPTCKYTCSLSAVEGTLYKYNVAKDQVFLDAIESGRQIKVTCEDGFLPNTQNYDVSSCVNGVWKPEIVKCNKT